jgi:histidinol phosphatase-like enzyme
MSKYKIGDRVEYVVDGVVQDTGTVTQHYKFDDWRAKWDSNSIENVFSGNDSHFRLVPTQTQSLEQSVALLSKSLDEIKELLQQILAK